MASLNRVMGAVRRSGSVLLQQQPAEVARAAASAGTVRFMSSAGGDGQIIKVTMQDEVAVVRINDPSSPVNTLNAKTMEEFTGVMAQLKGNAAVKAAVIISGKPDCFVAGADIKMLSQCKSSEELEQLAKAGQDIFNEIESSELPIVAAVQGSCLGGGMELALACHYRIVAATGKTKLGLPEVKLGLLPGAGGTQRLPRIVSLPDALPFLLTGKDMRPKKAKSLGVADRLVEELGPGLVPGEARTLEYLEETAVQAAKELAAGTLKVKKHGQFAWNPKAIMRYLMNDWDYGRDFVMKKAREGVLKATRGNYPSPEAILDVVAAGKKHGFAAGLKAEREAFGKLGMTSESAGLISLFFGMTELKKNPSGKPARPVKTLGVLGAGLMGAGIGEVSVQKFDLLLKDTAQAGLSRGQQQIFDGLNGKVKRRAMTAFERDTILSGMTGTLEWDGFEKADMVIEAVFEELGVKHKVLAEVEARTPSHCIFATNTSSLKLADIAKVAKRPENVIGMHYFSPVPKMPLLEIITTPETSKETLSAAYDVGLKQGKTIIVVKDVAGFYVNRCLGPFMSECISLVQDGVDPPALDNALLNYGFPVGPVALADEVGIDVAAHVQANVAKELGVRMQGGDPQALQHMIDAGLTGRKGGAGFYVYGKGKQKGPKVVSPGAQQLIDRFRAGRALPKLSQEDIQYRMVTRFVNEAAYCLQDDIIRSPTDGDMGAVFGIGFPPFRGGPFRLFDTYGPRKFVDMMFRFRDTYGEQFAPAQVLVDHANKGTTFFSK